MANEKFNVVGANIAETATMMAIWKSTIVIISQQFKRISGL